MKKLCVYATQNDLVHAAIVSLFERKTGAKAFYGLEASHCYIYNDVNGVVHGTSYKPSNTDKKQLITLKELYDMEDWKEEVVNIDGRDWSVSTIKEALKKHADY
jgi:hypothetical protein